MAENNNLDMTSSHSEKDIYNGCLEVMKRMVNRFEEYLEYIGVDLENQDEDEKFCVNFTPFEIVQDLFLSHTTHSGGTSTTIKCHELGIDDPYDPIKFTFSGERED